MSPCAPWDHHGGIGERDVTVSPLDPHSRQGMWCDCVPHGGQWSLGVQRDCVTLWDPHGGQWGWKRGVIMSCPGTPMVALGIWCDHVQPVVPTVNSGVRGCRVTVFPP